MIQLERFKDNDETEAKVIAVAMPTLNTLGADRDAFFQGAFSAYGLGEVLYDLDRDPMSGVITREVFVKSFPAIHQLFGGPDAQSLNKHPLAERGLKAHGAFEVRDSSWARSLSPAGGPRRKHFIFTFRDSVFECVANDVGIELIREDDDTVKLMSKRLYK